jgi:FkbM family methyltransferase
MKVILDFGTNTGEGLRSIIKILSKDQNLDNWQIRCFEPNNDILLDESLAKLPNIELNRQAVWNGNGRVQFSICPISSEGSSVKCLIDQAHFGHDNIITVDCVDIHTILSQYTTNDFIIIKLDIEGSEFTVLRRIIETGHASKINRLFVEWHTAIMSTESKDSEHQLRAAALAVGLRIEEWH